MIDPKTASEQMMYCTVRIVGRTVAGGLTGTGFLFTFPNGDQHVPVLITNKHVVDNTVHLEIRVHTRSGEAGPPDGNVDLELPPGQSGAWVRHDDPDADLCGLPILPILNKAKPTPFFRSLDPSLIPSKGQLVALDAMENVVMVGYPNGLWDEINNFPILRRGVTASHPAVDFDGKPVSIIDIAAFPGSSGSPVFLYNKSGYSDKMGNLTIGSDQLYFLGVLFAGPTIRSDGKIEIREAPTAFEAIPMINMMMNLGYIIKANSILTLGTQIFQRFNIKPPG